MPRKKLPRTPFLNARFGAAVKQFGLELIKTSSINNPGSKGTAREDALRGFFQERLPTSFAVVQGEVVDLLGQSSPQLDLMFFDQSVDFALNADSASILPAEALLASVEVKSSLNTTEISKSISAARKLRNLRPFGNALAGPDVESEGTRRKNARYLHCVFAYESNLTATNWLQNEAARFRAVSGDEHLVDVIYVLNRGIINLTGKIGRLEDEEGGAITNFYFSVLNFLERESARRASTPYQRYVTHATKGWIPA